MQKPRAVLFDMDGLMIDSELTRAKSFNLVISHHGGTITEKIPHVIGIRVIDNWQLIKDKYHLPETVSELMAEGEKEYTRLIKENMPVPMPGLFELVDFINTTGLKTAVVSSSGMEHIKIKLDKLNLSDFFQSTISGDSLTHGKPDPEGYILAAAKLKVKPVDCLVLEDAPSGVQAAKAAGMSCIAIPSTYSKNGDFSQADYVLKNLQAVVPILKNLTPFQKTS